MLNRLLDPIDAVNREIEATYGIVVVTAREENNGFRVSVEEKPVAFFNLSLVELMEAFEVAANERIDFVVRFKGTAC